ncbi:MAG: L-aspartate oxidase [Armatimonadetes bacterium]|nr:L-aspartate oxidase [Armatimonadota bacterium]
MERADFLVIGSGLAGLTFALEVAKHGRVIVLTKSHITDSNTNWAQGGIAAAVGESDSWTLHEQDTLTAGAGLCDPAAVQFLVKNAPEAIDWLTSLGARFDVTGSNELDLGREGGHSRHRIVHHADKTGWEVERTVSAAVRKNPNITVFENTFVTKLLVDNNRCLGVSAIVNDLGARNFFARATILATGGCGQIYSTTTNPKVATGDGFALAQDAGAELKNLEFQQFHPTTLVHPQLPGFLITEAMRGAGATLRNHRGRRFMYDHDSRLELAPRDIVARAIQKEIQRLSTWCVYLDATHIPAELLQREFPTIWEKLRTVRIEIEKDWIPISPAQHYACGGVTTDLDAKTNIPGLYASGEVTSTGVHGANRLASNSLLEAIVFSRSAALVAVDEADLPSGLPEAVHIPQSIPEAEAIRVRHAVQHLMSQHVGVFRTTKGLQIASEQIRETAEEVASMPRTSFSTYAQEAENIVNVSRLVADAAAARTENIGLHFNEDFA